MIHVTKTRSGLRVWVGISISDFLFFFHGSMKKFNQLAKKTNKQEKNYLSSIRNEKVQSVG